MSKKSEQRPEPNFGELFRQSLLHWGGWQKLVTGSAEVLVEPISDTIQSIAQHQAKSPARIGTLPPHEWQRIATTLPAFLNAYLQQELDRVLDGPRDFLTALRLVDDNLTAQLLFSVIIVARELHLDVEVSCKVRSNRKSVGMFAVCRTDDVWQPLPSRSALNTAKNICL